MVEQNQQQQEQAAAASAAAAAAASGQSDATARPAGLADDYWDGEKNAPRFDKLVPAFNDLQAKQAERDSFEARLPADVKGYEVGLPADFKLPEGMKFEVDADDPLIPVARQFALDNKLTPDAFKQLVGMRAQAQIAEDAALGAAAKAEMDKLGTSGPARVKAIETFVTAKLGNELANALLPGIFTAKQVEAYEKLMQLTKGSGVGGFNAAGREGDGKPDAPDFTNMSPAERIHAARQFKRATAA